MSRRRPPAEPACPCGSGAPLVACCGRFLEGKADAPDAERLMRSRYSAFVGERGDYLLATWLLPTGHPLAGAEKIAPQQLQGETLILTQEDPQGNTEELLRQYYNQLGLKGNPVLHTRTLEELFLLASAGVGIGLLPSSVPGYLRPDLCSVPIDGPQWSFSFLLISRRERSRASVRAMFELAEHL